MSVPNVRCEMRIERLSGPKRPLRQPNSARLSDADACENVTDEHAGRPGTYPVPAIVKPHASHQRQHQAIPGRASAAFVAQLLAGKMNLDVARTKRRASPETAQAAYAASHQRISAAQSASGASILM
jgi:hypothetical protein